MKEVISAEKGMKRLFFFIVGILATIAYRIIIVLNNYSKIRTNGQYIIKF